VDGEMEKKRLPELLNEYNAEIRNQDWFLDLLGDDNLVLNRISYRALSNDMTKELLNEVSNSKLKEVAALGLMLYSILFAYVDLLDLGYLWNITAAIGGVFVGIFLERQHFVVHDLQLMKELYKVHNELFILRSVTGVPEPNRTFDDKDTRIFLVDSCLQRINRKKNYDARVSEKAASDSLKKWLLRDRKLLGGENK
jgi:hypothetical protein